LIPPTNSETQTATTHRPIESLFCVQAKAFAVRMGSSAAHHTLPLAVELSYAIK